MSKELPRPTHMYQCVSRPGQCRFEWNCGPLGACLIRKKFKERSEQEKKDVAVAHARQARWRWRVNQKKKKAAP